MKDLLKNSAEEEHLLARCLKKDAGALKELTSLYGGSLYGLMSSALGQRAVLAYDVLTDSFVQTLRSSDARNLKEPLRVTLTRTLLDGLQKKIKQKHAGDPLPGFDRRLSVLFICLSRLPWEERMLLLLRDQMDFSLEEMALVFSLPAPEIKSRLQRVRIRFREQLRKVLKEKSPKIL